MVKRGTAVPKKLKDDSIVEAVFEIRFDTAIIPEILIGRFIDNEKWAAREQRQLPAYNIPAQLRSIDPNIKFSPIIELGEPNTKSILRLGPSVVSYHQQAPYVGWAIFKPELLNVINTLFRATKGEIVVKRLGLRYMNALRPVVHFVNSIADLDMQLAVSEEPVANSVNVNYTITVGQDTSCTVRIATKDFVQGALPEDTSVYLDVDVFTNEGFGTKHEQGVGEWVEFAHTQEKAEFFHLFKQELIDKLREA
jgi:uncharacterized protein (TIGR04255 family)